MQSFFTLGCDPELVCRRNGQFVPAHHFFKSNSSMGLDGNENIAEIRPGYSESPIDLTCKIYQILEYAHGKVADLEFYSGAFFDNEPLGGHCHFSLEPTPKIIEALNVVLGSLSNCIDDKQQKIKRERSGYGKKGSYRKKSYGFEYRSCSSFLISPSVSLVHLTLCKLAVLGVLEDNLNFEQLKERQHTCKFLRNLKFYLHTIPDDCKEGLKQLDTLLNKKLNWNQDILPNWGLRRAA